MLSFFPLIMAFLVFMTPPLCRAEEDSSDYFRVTADPLLNPPITAVFVTAVLQKLVDSPDNPEAREPYIWHKKNHFCLVGKSYKSDQDKQNAWIYWPEGRAILHWFLPTTSKQINNGIEDLSMDVNARDYTHLDKDVVPTKDDIGGSDYLVDRAWVDQIISDCQKYGEEFTIISHVVPDTK